LYLVLSFFFSLLGCLGGTNLPSCLDIYLLRFQGWALSWWCNMWSTLNKEVIFSFANFYSWTFCIIFTRLLIFWMTGRIFDEKRLWIFEGGNAMCMKSCFWSIIVSSDLWTVELQSLSPLVNAAATNSITPLTQQVDKVENIVCALFVLSHRIPDTFYIPLTIQLCGHSIPFSLTNQFPGESLWSGILL
jgi:hypothetical protein